MPLTEGLKRDLEHKLLAADTDLYSHKLTTDVVLKGHAYPHGSQTSFKVSLRVGRVSKTIQVFGDRTCHLTTTGRLLFSPEAPIEKVPLRYDFAYGGEDVAATAKHGNPFEALQRYLVAPLSGLRPSLYSYPRNLAGRGFLLEATPAAVEQLRLPNLEDPVDLLTPERLVCGRLERWPELPLPQAMDWVSLGWFPRLAYCGFIPDHDEPSRPIAEVARGYAPAGILGPKLITNKIDFRAASGASLGLQLPFLAGGEEFELTNLHPAAPRLSFRLPRQRPRIWTDGRNGKLNETEPVIHTVLIEPDEGHLSVVWRGSAPALRAYRPDELKQMPFRVIWT